MNSTLHRRLGRSTASGIETHDGRPAVSQRLNAALVATRSALAMNIEPTIRSVALANHLTTVPMRTPRVALADVAVTTPQVKFVPTLSKRKRFPVASVDFSKADIGLPFGVPRYVNAATLKAMAGGKAVDSLLCKTVAGWQFVADNVMVDLTDNSIQFKLGRLTILS